MDPSELPTDLAEGIASAVGGSEASTRDVPHLQEGLNQFSDGFVSRIVENEGHFALKRRWPNGAPYAACVTHDVDNVRRPLRHILSIRSRFTSGDLLLAILGLRSLYNNIRLVSRMERDRGLRGSFYVLTSNYELGSIADTLNEARSAGWEVGLHGEFGTHDSAEKLKEDIARFSGSLGFQPAGVREHFLRFDYSKTWQIMNYAGLSYDATVGTRDKLGFRLGLCAPFHPPDTNWVPMRILEIPLVLMDTTLWGYLKVGEDEGLADARNLLSSVARAGGLFTLLWHQESVRMKGGRIFPRVLDLLAQPGTYVDTSAGIAKWWNGRGVPLMRKGSAYWVDGDPPPGLCLEAFVKEGLIPTVEGGSVERAGDRFLVRVQSRDFRMEVE